MYKLLLCWRYLKTRYIALACIVSVTLGVATLIVTNSVMGGVSKETREHLNDATGDVILFSRSMQGMPNPEAQKAEIRKLVGDDVESMTAVARVPAMLGYYSMGQYITQQVEVVGIEPESYTDVCAFSEFLQHPKNREKLSFALRESGYDTIDHQAKNAKQAVPSPEMETAGWQHRRRVAEFNRRMEGEPATAAEPISDSPFATSEPVGTTFDPSTQQHTGAVVQLRLCAHTQAEGGRAFHMMPGDDIQITFPSAGRLPELRPYKLTIVDLYDSKMAQMMDDNFVFMPLEEFQNMRGMVDPSTGVRYVNAIMLRLKPGADLDAVRDKLRGSFHDHLFSVLTWRDLGAPILTALTVEVVILNLLLFLIIAVAGFGILAIFFMIVVEKTRDIGILKSLGASSWGIMGIFLSYGLGLGLVGAGLGVVLGLILAYNVQEIAGAVASFTGIDLYDPSIYPTVELPTLIDPLVITCIAFGAALIAVLASVLPAIRAARMHPVKALRFE